MKRALSVPAAIFLSSDGAEFLVRDYARGFAIIGPWTVDVLATCPSIEKACKLVEAMGAPGDWVYGPHLPRLL